MSHFRIELKAWIPHDEIPIPEVSLVRLVSRGARLRVPIWPQLLPFVPAFGTYLEGFYHGDGHVDYNGSFRVRLACECDFEEGKITDFTSTGPECCESIAYLEVGTFLRLWPGKERIWKLPEVRHTALAAPVGDARQTSDREITMWFRAGVPLTTVPKKLTPQINCRVVVSIDERQLTIKHQTALFPSYGVSLQLDGAECLGPDVLYDASTVEVSGDFLSLLPGLRLKAIVNKGTRTVRIAEPAV
jgi:hypothetical protein